MARNLYDIGDERSTAPDAWLHDRRDGRQRVVPMGSVLIALLLAVAGVALFRYAVPDPAETQPSSTIILDSFSPCDDPAGNSCTLSADRYIWHGGTYVVADIRAPSLDKPRCPQEADLARQGRAAMLGLMNGGAFDARPAPSGAQNRILMRDGVSLGSLLILKGYAKPAGSDAIDWCQA